MDLLILFSSVSDQNVCCFILFALIFFEKKMASFMNLVPQKVLTLEDESTDTQVRAEISNDHDSYGATTWPLYYFERCELRGLAL